MDSQDSEVDDNMDSPYEFHFDDDGKLVPYIVDSIKHNIDNYSHETYDILDDDDFELIDNDCVLSLAVGHEKAKYITTQDMHLVEVEMNRMAEHELVSSRPFINTIITPHLALCDSMDILSEQVEGDYKLQLNFANQTIPVHRLGNMQVSS